MKGQLTTYVSRAAKLEDPAKVRAVCLGLFRIILQHACVVLAEWMTTVLREQPKRLADFPGFSLDALRQPADGTLVALFSDLLVAAENIGWRRISAPLWDEVEEGRSARRLVREGPCSLERVLLSFVEIRNEGVEGHGLAGAYDPDAELDLIKLLIERFAIILPKVMPDGETLAVDVPGIQTSFKIQTLKASRGRPICYRKIRRISGGKCRISAQVQTDLLDRDEVVLEVPDVFADFPEYAIPQYEISSTPDEEWAPFVLLPERLTEDFTGREKEMQLLASWMEDPESRACMVYGDGGMGKTTLVVEYVHRLLERPSLQKWHPQLITFYTAKQTRWGLNGLEQIRATDVGVSDVVLSMARALQSGPLDRSWYQKNPKEVIQKLAGLLSELKIDRSSHLLILDNTETMAKSDEDVRALAEQIRELSRRVGRVLLTSRRRESIEALPIEILALNEEEGANFLKARGRAISCAPIIQAGMATLRKFSRQLGNKPLTLEVFVQSAAAPGTSLEAAYQRVQRMQRQDLGQFLYKDAWDRLSPEMRHLLLLMTRIADIHDDFSLQLCCMEVDVGVLAASEAIEESRGIATVTRMGDRVQIVFNNEFMGFCAERKEVINGVAHPTSTAIEHVKKRYSEFLRSATLQVHDRNEKAFRHPYARLAWKYFQEDDFEEALFFYDLAESADKDNGWLFERYAYALFRLKRLPEALKKAVRATELLPADPEAWFTRGIVEGRLKLGKVAVQSLQRANSLGKPAHLCLLQQAYAYVHMAPPDKANARACIDEAERRTPKDKYQTKMLRELRHFRSNWLGQSSMDKNAITNGS